MQKNLSIQLEAILAEPKEYYIAKIKERFGEFDIDRFSQVMLFGAAEMGKIYLELCKKNNLNVFVDFEETDAINTWKKFSAEKKFKDCDLILVDTAGRHTLDDDLIKEIKSIFNLR